MLVDALLRFSNAQAVTAAAASDSVVDLGAARDLGTGERLYLVVSVAVAMTDSGSNSTLTVALQGDSTDTFTPDGATDVLLIPAVSAAGFTAIAALSPGALGLAYRYLRLYYTPNNGDLSAGSFTSFLTHNIQKYVSYNDNIQITG